MEHKRLQWHPPFTDASNLELIEEAWRLTFIREYQLSQKPLMIDLLIVNEHQEIPIKKTIGRIFRKYNVLEYKSPEDYVSINDYYKVFAYSGLYQSLTAKVMEVDPDDITVTFAGNHFPRGLFKHLKQRYGSSIEHPFPGIYYISGLMFPTQLVILPQLPPKEYVWLSRLRANLTIEDDIEVLALAYKGHEHDPMYASVMNIIMKANMKLYEEAKDMCTALRELFADELKEKWIEGVAQGKVEGIAEGKTAGVAESLIEFLEEVGEVSEPLKKYIYAQKKRELLSSWIRLAAKTGSIEEFSKKLAFKHNGSIPRLLRYRKQPGYRLY